jgi:hypothetical protein
MKPESQSEGFGSKLDVRYRTLFNYYTKHTTLHDLVPNVKKIFACAHFQSVRIETTCGSGDVILYCTEDERCPVQYMVAHAEWIKRYCTVGTVNKMVALVMRCLREILFNGKEINWRRRYDASFGVHWWTTRYRTVKGARGKVSFDSQNDK